MSLEEVLPFFENRSYRFQEAVCIVFGTEIRDKEDIFYLTEDFYNLMWHKVNNGRVLSKREIYLVRGESVPILGSEKSKHHWPPGSRGGRLTIKVPSYFHTALHDVFMNLYTLEEFYIFWDMMFSMEEVVLRDVVDQARKEAKRANINRKRG